MKQFFKYLLIGIIVLVGSFTIWVKFFLSEHEEFINSTIFEHRQSISTDGPHILYEKDSIRIIQVEKDGKNFATVDKRISREYLKDEFTVNSFDYDKSTPVSFKFRLKDSLKIPEAIHTKPDSIFIVSDIEGNFYAFHKLLLANRVIDKNCNWNFGTGHLVLVGDFVDRGLNVTQCLWLIYKLENQAIAQGGNVHFIIGNHEFMNLKGINRNVRTKYKKLAKKSGLDYTTDLYGINSELGRWLRTKNSMIKIGDLLFMHGGISKEFLDLNLTINQTNAIIRNNIDIESKDSVDQIVIGYTGPLKSREFGHGQNSGTRNIIEKAKRFYNISTIIIGHSTVDDIYQEFENSLINVDVHFPHNDDDQERGKALLIEHGIRYKVDDYSNKTEV